MTVFNKMLYKCHKKIRSLLDSGFLFLDWKGFLVFDNLFGKFLIVCCYVDNVSSGWKS